MAGAVVTAGAALAQTRDASDWGYYGGDMFGQRFSRLSEVNRKNVTHLTVAWTYRTGENGAGFARANKLSFEATPILAFGLLYLETPTNILIALDPETGVQRWRYDPHIDRSRLYAEASSRGVSIWEDSDSRHTGACTRRVLTGTLDARLLAVDAGTGEPCQDFGTGGQVDLTNGLRIRDRADYLVTSPPAIYGNVVVVGAAIGDNRAVDVERGVIRAFDARSGALLWAFDPIPDSPAHPAAAEWDLAQAAATGAANSWGLMSIDEDNGLVLVPTGSASPDYFGGTRLGSNRFADSLLALDAKSGKLVWHQQLVHHDLWDYDLAAPTCVRRHRSTGRTGAGGHPGHENRHALRVRSDQGGSPSSRSSRSPCRRASWPASRPHQHNRSPPSPRSCHRKPVDPADAWGVTFWDRGKCRDLLSAHRNEGIFTPPDPHGTLLSPGYIGGVNWGGIAFDEQRQRVIAAVNHLPMLVTLVPQAELQEQIRSGDYPNSDFAKQAGTPYAMRREPLLSPWGLPCTAPPWGTLVSVDLRRNRIVWQVPLGSTEGIGPWFAPTRDFGMPNMGGPIATAGDLVFVGAAMDSYFRAFDIETGRELWKHKLPAGGQATPMTYRAGRNQRQFIVIAAGRARRSQYTPR